MSDNIISLDAIRRYRAGVKLRAAEGMVTLTTPLENPIKLTPCTSFSLSSDNLAELSSEAGKVNVFVGLFKEPA